VISPGNKAFLDFGETTPVKIPRCLRRGASFYVIFKELEMVFS
jgi:hypothetical protein